MNTKTATNISINRAEGSPFWMCSFVGPDGKQKRRSTKVPVAGGMFNGEKLSAKQAEKRALLVGAQIAEAEYSEHHSFDNTTVREHVTNYERRAAARLAEGSIRNNKTAFSLLLKWLGKRADQPLRLFTRADAKAYAEQRRERVRASTLEREVGCLRTCFEDAVDSELLLKNPWRNLRIAPDHGPDKVEPEAFTFEELQYILDNFPEEWSSAVRCSFETFGQRLGDIRMLKWSQFDWEKKVVTFYVKKNKRTIVQPMRPAFFEWARAKYEASGSNPTAYVHPRLARATTSVSGDFTLLLEAHGIGRRVEASGGDKNAAHTKTFHSVRRTAATLLHATGISETMAMKLIGHKSAAVHSVYVKPDTEMLRGIASKMPEL